MEKKNKIEKIIIDILSNWFLLYLYLYLYCIVAIHIQSKSVFELLCLNNNSYSNNKKIGTKLIVWDEAKKSDENVLWIYLYFFSALKVIQFIAFSVFDPMSCNIYWNLFNLYIVFLDFICLVQEFETNHTWNICNDYVICLTMKSRNADKFSYFLFWHVIHTKAVIHSFMYSEHAKLSKGV